MPLIAWILAVILIAAPFAWAQEPTGCETKLGNAEALTEILSNSQKDLQLSLASVLSQWRKTSQEKKALEEKIRVLEAGSEAEREE